MYIPKKLQMESQQQIHDFIDEFGFAVLTTSNLTASHLPLLLKREEGELGTLYGHLAKANSHWKSMDCEPILAVFSGPHGYISPTWYDSFPAVPTWNYAAVHIKGEVSLTDEETTLQVLTDTIDKYESGLLSPLNNSASEHGFIPAEYKAKLSKAIIGFKISITSIEGKLKLGQHRTTADQLGVIAGLNQSTRLDDQALLAYTKRHTEVD
ncbi:FMN-binding negative transcriptional regulator [Shewanella olleyana]|uniref:FMN-binding negative transcriptional regulator n=1 Tax=Shewanella olleyana TaxID=135626 RepID=UPI00200F5DAB|nr:FMN-binding negative transcriptional regulator [Shewanella olleyana]MCL1065571.1 FMN-binding negative transcriptional regulator [Shewanella olleyana]